MPANSTFILKNFIFAVFLSTLSTVSAGEIFHDAASDFLQYSDYIYKEFITPKSGKGTTIRFNRGYVLTGKGYGWDNPGARVRWKTNAKSITVRLVYTDKHDPKRAHNSVGAFYIDGVTKPEWTFMPAKSTPRPAGEVVFSLPAKSDGEFHTYELIMPYGDSVDFAGIDVNDTATFQKPPARPKTRALFYGDSVTHGFTASEIRHTYPYLVSLQKDWELLNIAIGGQSSRSSPEDAGLLNKLEFDILVVAIGVNDWQGKRPPQEYRNNMKTFIEKIRKKNPETPVYIISPLWVADFWGKKICAKYPLEDYRKELKELITQIQTNDANLFLINGDELIDHDEKLFDQIAVHPNDTGFVQMSSRMTKQIKDLKK